MPWSAATAPRQHALTPKLAFELGPHGITVNAFTPSLTLPDRLLPHREKRSREGQEAESQAHPLGRVATPEDQAGSICFLGSSEVDFVNRVTIDRDGRQ
jgi:3-oxoacyl-[acyl-carrier protein] reductase